MKIQFSQYQEMNSYELYQSEYYGGAYESRLKESANTLSTPYGKDIDGIFLKAIGTHQFSDEQVVLLEKFRVSFQKIEKQIEPDRLDIEIISGYDDNEAIIVRKSEYGLTRLIIHEDGLIAHSFISFKGSGKADFLTFYEEQDEQIDFEGLAYTFLSI